MSLIFEFLKKASWAAPRANKIYKEHFSDDAEKLAKSAQEIRHALSAFATKI